VELVQHLQNTYEIPKDNILTHASIVWKWCKSKRLWDWITPSRKIDIHRNFWADRWFANFEEFRTKKFSWKN
jgi:hypothetical protein